MRKGARLIQQTCRELGVRLAMEKLEGPATCLTFLGIEVDTMEGVLCLPQDKLSRMREALAKWECKKSELESLVGTLQHACRVVRPGRSFLRRMIDLLCIQKRAYHHIHLNGEFRADLWWWSTFASHWNGVAFFPPAQPAHCDGHIGRVGRVGLWCVEPAGLVPIQMASSE